MGTRKLNGRASRLAPQFNSQLMLTQAEQLTAAASTISRITEDVAEGADVQVRTLERTVVGVNEMAASLKETAGQADSVAVSTEELLSSVNEMAASIEQVTANTTSLSVSVAQTAASIEQNAASVQQVTGTAQEMAASAQQVTASIAAMAGSVRSVARDTESLTASVNETGAAVEQLAGSVREVSASADDLAASAEETSSSINEIAASIEEVGAMTERLATAVEQNSTAIEQMSKSVSGVAQNGSRIADAARDASVSATQMERSIASVSSLARSADDVSRRVSRDAEEGGNSLQRSIQGISRMRESMVQSAAVMREMGKRTGDITSIVDTINLFSSLGMDNQITELDVSIYSNSLPGPIVDYADIPVDRLISQGYRYRTFFDAFKELQGKISSITFWGQADDHTWLTSPARVNGPLLFDTSLKKKFAYWGLIDPLQLPGADLSADISATPNPVISGQTISYTMTVRNNADNDSASFLPQDDDLPAANVLVVTAVPAGTSFRSLTTPDGWLCDNPAVGQSGAVQCSIGSLAAGTSAVFTLTVEVNCPAIDGTQVANSVGVSSTTADPNLAPNNGASVTVNVSNPAPVISGLAVDKPVLGSPNHQIVDVTLTYTIEDNCDSNLVPEITITSDQPQNGTGDGDTDIDWEVVDAHHIRLRAERSPTSAAGRTYTIVVKVTDSAGASDSSSVTVVVPR